jgi:8-oxo-dGTP diphosphatase
MGNEVQTFYGNRLRVRACGICVKNNSILMVEHEVSDHSFWSPPGGGIQFGEPAAACLSREFKEETGLSIRIEKFLFACEFIQNPLHAVELFFEVSSINTKLNIGSDPEPGSPSIIRKVKFMSWSEIIELPNRELHGIFKYVDHPSKITTLRGYFKV